MSMFHVDVVAVNPGIPEREGRNARAFVDTGSEYTWMPAQVLDDTGIERRRTRSFVTATGERFTRPVGYAILRVADFETVDEVVFAEPSDTTLLGARTIEGVGAYVDNVERCLVPHDAIKV